MFLCKRIFVITILITISSSYQTAQLSKEYIVLRTNGIFANFLRDLFDQLLSEEFRERKLPKYCKILGEELKSMDYRYTRKLGKHIYKLSKKYIFEIRDEISMYRTEIDRELPHRKEFLNAMDEIFTMGEYTRFHDYLLDLKDYGMDDKLFIEDETRYLLRDVIVHSVFYLSAKEQDDLYKKLKKAYKEYKKREYE